jgi:ADP-heptose:LPS heptosyltransferase
MASSNLFKRILRSGFDFITAGRFFRFYAPHSPPAPPGGPRTIAICDLIPHLGDKVMIFPLLDAVRSENPDLEISYFTPAAGRFIGLHPAIDHLYLIEDRPANRTRIPGPFLLEVMRWWWLELRSLRFDTIVVLRGGVEPWFSRHLAWLLGGRIRVAYSPRLEPERYVPPDTASLFTAEVTEMKGVHEVSRGSEVLQLAGLLRDPVDIHQPVDSMLVIARSEAARAYLKELGLLDRPYAVFGPGAAVPRRAWPAARFAELARDELLPRGWQVVIVGGPETAAVATIRALLGEDVLDLTGKTNFEQLTAVCGGAQCFLGNDSGTSHVAGACGVPTLIVTAFARSGRPSHHASPNRSHPLGPWVAVVQPERQVAPCTTECLAGEVHCIDQVTVQETQTALRNLLGRSTGDSSRLGAPAKAGVVS